MKFGVVGFVGCVLLAVGCEAPVPVPVEAKVATEYHYSPFVVQVPESAMVFDIISFKDVGLRRDVSDPADPMLETIAESVSYQLQMAPELAVSQSTVEYLEEYADPANHKSCEQDHLYVDVWNGRKGWGYSLWSGCGDADNFAKQEVATSSEPDSSLADRVEPLADSIAEALVHAHQHKCFVKRC